MIMLILAGASYMSTSMAYTGIPVGARGLGRRTASQPLRADRGAHRHVYPARHRARRHLDDRADHRDRDPDDQDRPASILVWFGIFLVLVVEMAEVSPPVGFNLFVLQTMSGKDSNTVALRLAAVLLPAGRCGCASSPYFLSIVMVLPQDGVSRLAPREVVPCCRRACIDHRRYAWRCCLHSRLRPRRRPNGTCPPPIRPTIRTPSICWPSPRT